MNIPTRAYSYRPQSSVEYTRFKSDYFSGTDVRIYFGDTWIDEVTSLEFALQEQVAPIFGYASHTWDRVARGTRHVQGAFRINFKENSYLNIVLQEMSRKVRKRNAPESTFSKERWQSGVTTEHLLSNDKDFDKIAQQFEKSLWGEGGNSDAGRAVNNKEDNTHFYPVHQTGIGDDGLEYDEDISQRELAEHGFNILIGYGPLTETGGQSVPGAIHTLIGVQLTGVRQIIQGDGMPIEEEYTFIARDLDGNIGAENKHRKNYAGTYTPIHATSHNTYSHADATQNVRLR